MRSSCVMFSGMSGVIGAERNDIILLCYDDEGTVHWKKNMTNTANKEEIEPHLAVLDNQLVLTWTNFAYLDQTKGLVEQHILVDKEGNKLQKPMPFLSNSALILKKIGEDFDVSSNDMPACTKFIPTRNGKTIVGRFMPYFYKNYLEVIVLE